MKDRCTLLCDVVLYSYVILLRITSVILQLTFFVIHGKRILCTGVFLD